MNAASPAKGQGEGQDAFVVDSGDFCFNKSELGVSIEARGRPPLRAGADMRLPAYVRTCLEELSRDCCVYYQSPGGPSAIPAAAYPRQDSEANFPMNEEVVRLAMDQLKAQQPAEQTATPQSGAASTDRPILQHYHPDYTSPPSSFKRAPPHALRRALQEEPFNRNMLLNVGPITQPAEGQSMAAFKPRLRFEPIFGSVAVYAVVPSRKSFDIEDLVRVTESFNFDVTDQMSKDKYPEVYEGGRPKGEGDTPDPADAAAGLSACLFSVPMEYRKDDLFLVVQLTKVTTTYCT
jgi:hypothetical protein